jgi:hypothetical protein
MPQKSYSSYPKSHIFGTDEKFLNRVVAFTERPVSFETRPFALQVGLSSRRW